jgi:stage III sporulation protein AD
MVEIVKIIGIGLVSVVLIIVVKQYRPEFAIYISLLAGAIILFMVLEKLTYIVNLLQDISSKVAINNNFLSILLKITGIAILTEFAVSICKDSGENAIATKIEIASKIVIIAMSIPIISNLLELMIQILP